MIDLLVGPITKLLDKFIPDADTKQHISHEIATMAEKHAHAEAKMQMEVNKQEAAHKNVFVAGWRPAVGWVCVAGMTNHFIIMPYVAAFDLGVAPMDWASLSTILLGLLGMGGLRTYEKINKVSRER